MITASRGNSMGRTIQGFLTLAGLLIALGCSGGGGNTPPPPPPAPSITSFSANPPAITAGQSSTLSWTTANAATVSISGVAGAQSLNGNASVQPATTTTYTLTAANSAGTATTSATTITVTPAPTITSVTVSPSTPTLITGQTQQFTATVTGTGSYNQAVTWSASGGTINASTGLYMAPGTAGSFTVTATSVQDSAKSGSTTVTANPAQITISIAPNDPNLVIQPGQSRQFLATVTGGTNQNVTWSLGTATPGTLSSTGLYTAPAGPVNALGAMSVTVTSVVDPSAQATALFQLVPTAATALSLPAKAQRDYAVAGEACTFNLGVFSQSAALTITSYSVTGPAGAAPSVDASGLITWTPDNAQLGPKVLVLHVVADNGTAKDFSVALEVLKTERIITGTCGNEGGSFGDLGGNFMITIPPNAVAAGSSQVNVTVDRLIRQSGRILYRPNYVGLAADVSVQTIRQIEAYAEATGLNSGTGAASLNSGAANVQVSAPSIIDSLRVVEEWKGYRLSGRPWDPFFSTQWYSYLNESIAGAGYDYCQDTMAILYGEAIPKPLPTYIQPILFVHGFTLNPHLDKPTGGGSGTWGFAPDWAKSLAIPVGLTPVIYEFKWKTAARFEDQAYNLGLALFKIKEETGQAPIVLAHSFGGVLCWTYLMDLAVNTNIGCNINAPAVKATPGAIKQLVTVDSPIGGIAWGTYAKTHTSNIPPNLLTWTLEKGCADGDLVMAGGSQLTMVGAGAPVVNDDGRDNLSTSSNTQMGLLKLRNFYAEPVGSTVGKIWDAAGKLRMANKTLPCPVTTLVGIARSWTPLADFHSGPGDGLISFTGQTFPVDSALLINSWDRPAGSPGIPGQPGHTYRMMSFTSGYRIGFLHNLESNLNPLVWASKVEPLGANFFSADISSDGQIKVGTKTFDHPLKTAMGVVIAEVADHFQINVPALTTSNFHAGPVTWDGVLPTSDQVVYRLSVNKKAANGAVTTHLFPQASVQYGGTISEQFSLSIGTDESATWKLNINDTAQKLVAQSHEKSWVPNISTVDLDAVHLASLQSSTVSFSARVINTSGAPVAEAEVRLWEGNIVQTTIQSVSLANTLVSRVLRTNSGGTVYAPGMAPAATCTVLIQAAGYDPYFTTVSLASSGAFEFTLSAISGTAVSITSFTAAPATIAAGESAVLTPVFLHATSASIDNGVGAVTTGTNYTVWPTATTTYTLTANGAGGPVTRPVTVTVTGVTPVSIDSFTATPSTIVGGQSATLTPVFANATTASIDNGVGAVTSGTGYTVWPTVTTTYTLTAEGTGGPVTRTVTVTVTVGTPVSISSFTASPMTITAGQTATLTPVFANATSATISPGVVGNVTSGVGYPVMPTMTTTYTLTANGTGGPITRTVTVTVTAGTSVSITSFTAAPVSISAGQSAVLTPVFQNATSASINQGVGAVTSGMSYTVTPLKTTSYTLTANGTGGPVTRGVTVTVGSGSQPSVDLGTLGGTSSKAVSINTSGMVVGESTTPGNTTTHAFAWTQAGGMVDLGTLGGTVSGAAAINDNGMVVGFSGTPGSTAGHAFAWTQAGGMVDLGTLGGTSSSAVAINDNGMVVGYSDTPGNTTSHAFAWTQAGGMIDLGSLSGGASKATAVNINGMVVGFSSLTGGANHAFVWTQAAGMVDLGTLGGPHSNALAINNNGMVVGWANLPGPFSNNHAFAWTQTGGMVDLGTLGGLASTAAAVNNNGMVVGFSDTAPFSGSPVRAFSWTPGGGMVNLGTLPGAVASEALAVNANGKVVGNSYSGGDLLSTKVFAWTQAGGMVDLGYGLISEEIRGGAFWSFSKMINSDGMTVGKWWPSATPGVYHAVLWP